MRIKNLFKIIFQDGTVYHVKDKNIKTMSAAADYAKRLRPGCGEIMSIERY